jgi:hypothetical protein
MHTKYSYTCDAAKELPFCGMAISPDAAEKTVSAVYGNSDPDRYRIRIRILTVHLAKFKTMRAYGFGSGSNGSGSAFGFQNLQQCELTGGFTAASPIIPEVLVRIDLFFPIQHFKNLSKVPIC